MSKILTIHFIKSMMRGVIMIALSLLLSGTVMGGIHCGDVDADGHGPDIADLSCLINYLYLGGPQPPVLGTYDLDSDGGADISDLSMLIDHLFITLQAIRCNRIIQSDWQGACTLYSTEGAAAARTSSGGCISSAAAAAYGEYVEARFVGAVLHVTHKYAFINCCSKYAVTWQVVGNQITLFEADTASQQCECMCYFNFESVRGMALPVVPQQYVVTVVGVDGAMVGADTLWMGVQGKFSAEAFGRDVYLRHENAPMDCCGKFTVDYTVVGNTIFAQEMDSASVPCGCCGRRDLISLLHDVAPGTYEIVLTGLPYWPGPGSHMIGVDTVTVGSGGGPGGPCYYTAIVGQALFTDFLTAPSNGYNCVNAKDVRFAFLPQDPTAPNRYLYPGVRDQWIKFTVGAGMNPSQSLLDAKGIYKSATFPCERREQTYGTCTSVVFVFPTIDLRDWGDYCWGE